MADRGTARSEADALAQLEAHRRQLQGELATLQGKLAAVDQAIQLLRGEATPSPEGLAAARDGKYASLPVQEAIALFLRDHPGKTFKASEVARDLRSAGFVPRARNFPSQVAVALNRLCKKGVAAKTKREGVTAYRLAVKRSPSGGA